MEFEKIKKAEVHLHLDGSISKETLYELYRDKNQILKEEFYKMVSVDGNEKTLSDYLKKFEIPLEILQSYENLERVAREIAQRVTFENYIYSEIRFAPHLHLRKGLSLYEVVSSVSEGINCRIDKSGYVGIILCIMRHLSEEEAFEIVKLAEKFRNSGVVGIDIAGDEKSFSVEKFKRVFEAAKSEGIKFTIHAGEARGAESVKKAIEYGANRIGHGVRCIEDKSLVELIAEKEIMLEMCPISNLQTGVYTDYFNLYPVKKLLEKGVKIGLNSDNHTVSDTNLIKEAEFLNKNFDIDKTVIKEMIRNNIKYGFAEKEIIKKVLKEFDNV